MVGLNTGKCLDYGTKNTYCRKCLGAENRGLILNLMTVALTMLGQLKKWGRRGKDFGPNWGGGVRLAMHDSKNCLKLLTCLWQSSCEGLSDATLSTLLLMVSTFCFVEL